MNLRLRILTTNVSTTKLFHAHERETTRTFALVGLPQSDQLFGHKRAVVMTVVNNYANTCHISGFNARICTIYVPLLLDVATILGCSKISHSIRNEVHKKERNKRVSYQETDNNKETNTTNNATTNELTQYSFRGHPIYCLLRSAYCSNRNNRQFFADSGLMHPVKNSVIRT